VIAALLHHELSLGVLAGVYYPLLRVVAEQRQVPEGRCAVLV
jgi:hypothetical protein